MASNFDLLRDLEADAQASLLTALTEADKAGIRFRITSGRRSTKRQGELYEDFISGRSKLPAAPPGRSKHEHGVAADIVLSQEGDRQKFNQILSQHGWTWPLGKKDHVHYEFGAVAPDRVPAFSPPKAAKAESIPEFIPPFKPAAKAAKAETIPEFIPSFKPPKTTDLGPYLPGSRNPRDPRTGRIIDPSTGRPFPKPGKKAAEPSRPTGSFVDLAPPRYTPEQINAPVSQQIKAGVAGGVEAVNAMTGGLLNRVGAPLYPVRDLLNKVADEKAKLGKKYGGFDNIPYGEEVKASLTALRRWAPWETFKQGVMKGKATEFEFWRRLAEGDAKFKAEITKYGGPAMLDFLTSIPIDAVTGQAANKLIGGAQKAVTGKTVTLAPGVKVKGVDVQGKAEELIPAFGQKMAGRRAYRDVQQTYSRQDARAEAFSREAAENAEDLWRTSQAYLRKGAPVRGKDPLTKRTVNRLDELVADYVEHGSEGAKFQTIQEVEAQAARLGVAMADVQRIGDRYRKLADDLGQEMVRLKILSPDAYQRLSGQYLPRLYLMSSAKPREAKKFLKVLEANNRITPEAAGFIRQRLRTRMEGLKGSGEDFTKAREITDFQDRVSPEAGRLAEGSATPAFTRYTQNATREIAEARALEEIATNPALSVPKAQASSSQLANWGRMTDGPLKDHLVRPEVLQYIRFRNSPDAGYAIAKAISPEFAEGWRKLNTSLRAIWISSPRTAVNNAAGNYQLGESAAAINGGRGYNLANYGASAKMVMAERKGERVADRIAREFYDQTDLAKGGAGIIPSEARSVTSGFGVETTGQKLAALPGKAWEGYTNVFYRDVEQAGRLALYRSLRQGGKSVDEAARITRAAMIDYSDIGPLRRALDRNNILPFITFPTKAIFQWANLAARRPDLFDTYTGQRMRTFLDTLSDDLAVAEGQRPEAREKRRKGEAKLTEFPIPGRRGPLGEQQYARTSLLAPILQGAPAGADADLLSPLEDQVKRAAPLFRVPAEILLNARLGASGPQPIVPEGSVPGAEGTVRDVFHSPEAALAFGSHLMRGFVPQAADVERGYRAITQTSPYPSRYAPRQGMVSALIRGFTGVQVQEGIADNPLQARLRSAARVEAPRQKPFIDFAETYEQDLLQRKEAGQSWGNPDYRRYLGGKTDSRELKKWLDEAKKRLPEIIVTDAYTGDDRNAAIRRMVDWLYEIADRFEQLKGAESEGLSPELAAMAGVGP